MTKSTNGDSPLCVQAIFIIIIIIIIVIVIVIIIIVIVILSSLSSSLSLSISHNSGQHRFLNTLDLYSFLRVRHTVLIAFPFHQRVCHYVPTWSQHQGRHLQRTSRHMAAAGTTLNRNFSSTDLPQSRSLKAVQFETMQPIPVGYGTILGRLFGFQLSTIWH
jgi:preprotein translocase subunit SecG